MKKTRVSLLALAVLAGGMLAAAAATNTFRAYELNADYDDNANAKIWWVRGGPENPTDAVYPHFAYQNGSLVTDGSGKISGMGEWRITYSSSGTPFTTFYGTIVGKLAGKIGTAATVTMTVKADGYTVDGTNYANPFKGSFKFTGQAGTAPGNANDPAMVGLLTGSASGSTPADPKGFKLPPGRVAYIDRSGFGYASINADVLQSSRGTMQLFSSSLQGNGSIKNNATYRATVKGVGSNKGVSVSFSGAMALKTDNVGTNPISFLAPTTAEILKGSKSNGQAIQGAAARVTADLFPNP
jgi:hypothetical protein